MVLVVVLDVEWVDEVPLVAALLLVAVDVDCAELEFVRVEVVDAEELRFELELTEPGEERTR